MTASYPLTARGKALRRLWRLRCTRVQGLSSLPVRGIEPELVAEPISELRGEKEALEEELTEIGGEREEAETAELSEQLAGSPT